MNEYDKAFLCGFAVCLLCVCFPVVLALMIRAVKRVRKVREEMTAKRAMNKLPPSATCEVNKAKRLAVMTLRPQELPREYWNSLRNVFVGLGYTVNVTFEDGHQVARFYMKEPNS